MALLRDSADNRRDETIQAQNVDGLNTVASALNAPYGSTPDTLNTVFTVGGEVHKRPGTHTAATSTGGNADRIAEKSFSYTVRTALGYNYLLVAGGFSSGLDVRVYRMEGEDATLVMTKDDVFSQRVYNQSVQFTELQPGRVLLTTGVNAPVEFWFVTTRRYNTGGGSVGGSTYPLTANPFGVKSYSAPAEEADLEVFVDGTKIDAANWSLDGNGIFFENTIPSGTTIDVVQIVWGWWAQAELYDSDRMFDSVPRFQVYTSDRHLQIPDRLRDNIQTADSNLLWPFTFTRKITGNNYAAYTLSTSASGTKDGDDFWFSNGTADNAVADDINQQNTHITFASHTFTADEVPSSEGAVRVSMRRWRPLSFQNNSNVGFADIVCWLVNDETEVPHVTTASSTTVVLNQTAYTLVKDTNYATPDGTGNIWGFTGERIPTDQILLVYDDISLEFIGQGSRVNAFNGSITSGGDGFPIPIAGLAQFCDYEQGVFPYTASLYQNRLVLGGFANDPLKVILSAPTDTYWATYFYNYFQTDVFNNPETEPLEFRMDGSNMSDFIRRVETWQGSLFIFSRDGTWRLLPGQQGQLYTQKIGTGGLVDGDAVALGDGRLFFASAEGVFEMVQTEGLADSYAPQEVSAAIRDKFPSLELEGLAYDANRAELYAYSADELYVFFAQVGGWSQWEWANGFGQLGASRVWDGHDNERVGFFMYDSVRDRQWLLLTYKKHPSDSENKAYWYLDGFGASSTFGTPTVSSTAEANQKHFYHGLRTIGLLEVQDLQVTIDGVVQTFQTDWHHFDDESIYIDKTLAGGETVLIEPRNPETGQVDNGGTIGPHYVGLTGIGSGWAYPCKWTTIRMTQGMLANYKRYTYLNLFMTHRLDGGIVHINEDGATLSAGDGFNPINCSVAFIFEDARYGDTTTDIFDAYSLVYDPDFLGSNIKQKPYILLREYIQGIGYNLQSMLWNWSESVFGLAGFQLEGKVKGTRYIPR